MILKLCLWSYLALLFFKDLWRLVIAKLLFHHCPVTLQIQDISVETEDNKEKKSAKDALLLWCQMKTAGWVWTEWSSRFSIQHSVVMEKCVCEWVSECVFAGMCIYLFWKRVTWLRRALHLKVKDVLIFL